MFILSLSASLFHAMASTPALHGIHALHAVNAPLPHRLAASDMGAGKLASAHQKHLYAQKCHRNCNKNECQ